MKPCMKPVRGEFLKGGALSVDKLIEERAPPVVKNPYFSISNDFKNCVMCKRPRVTAVIPSPRSPPHAKKPKSTTNARDGFYTQRRPQKQEPTKATPRSACFREL